MAAGDVSVVPRDGGEAAADLPPGCRDAPPAPRRLTWVALGIGAAAVAALRLWHCAQPPVNTGDVTRHILYGAVVDARGLSWAAAPLAAINPGWGWVAWSQVPYNYPVLALAFFAGVAAVHPTVLAVKVALTAIEAVNAVLVGRLTRNKWLGLLYWAYPMSVWWVSREAQFEPVQSLLALLALLALRRNTAVACALLALAIQTKVTAVMLLPLFVVRAWQGGLRAALWSAGAFTASFVPTAAAMLLHYPSIMQLARGSAALRYNPYWWNPLDAAWFAWNPRWIVVANQIGSYALLAGLAVAALRSSRRLAYLAPIAFAIVLKVHVCVQFWYWLTMPVFLVAIPDRRIRAAALVLLPLVDVYGLAELVAGPFGYTVGTWYYRLGP